MQLQYDRETNHSLNVNKQLEWNDKIAAEIQKLKDSISGKKLVSVVIIVRLLPAQGIFLSF